jgi:tetratricopeptide (TPR) repeat protein
MSSDDLVALILGGLLGLIVLERTCFRAIGRGLGSTHPRVVLACARLWRRFPAARWGLYEKMLIARAHKAVGETDEGVELMRSVLADWPRDECPWIFVNSAVDLFVSSGCYRDALSAARGWSKSARLRGRKSDRVAFAITRINQAEALHNLGRDTEALARLDEASRFGQGDPLAMNGLSCLRSWILLHRGELHRARREIASVDASMLPNYEAEVAYTWAALERESGNLSLALTHAEHGLSQAQRVSSKRNGQFLVAGIAALMGDSARARSLFDAGVAADYCGQGGDGLFRFAAFLDAEGEHQAAARVLALLVERDPESIFARRAREALSVRDASSREFAGVRLTETPSVPA